MNEKTEPQSIASKLVEIMKECSHISKNGTNNYHGYSYATSADVLQMVNASLSRHHMCSIATPELLRMEPSTTSKGTEEHLATVRVDINLIDGDTGETLTISGIGSGQDAGDKAVMKAQTAAIKYAYLLSFAICTDDDPERDENYDSYKSAPQDGSTRGKAGAAAPFPDHSSFHCQDCGASISEKVDHYSRQYFGRPLCLNCQHSQRKQA